MDHEENHEDEAYAQEKQFTSQSEGPAQEQTASLLSVLHEWTASTSVHGLHDTLDRAHFRRWKRTLWALIVSGAFSAMIWQLAQLINDYREFKVNTSTETSVPPSLPFPQITVCNSNLFSTYLQQETGIFEPINDEELIQISTSLVDFIQYTEFNAGVFNGTEVAQVWNPVVTPAGLCFQFETDEKVLKPGYNGGLHFWAWLGQDAYEASTVSAGLVLFVTERGTLITQQTPVVILPPGVDSFVGISANEFQRETEAPWSTCVARNSLQYSQPLCRSECLNEADRQACGCRRIGDPAAPDVSYCTSADWDACSLPNEEDVLSKCDCTRPPCSETIYPARVTSRAYSKKFLQVESERDNVTADEFLSNFVAVTINYDAMRMEVVTETKATSFSQLLSSIGGTMGLYAGISVISTFEILGDLVLLRLFPRLWVIDVCTE